jgi:hypothetical protein
VENSSTSEEPTTLTNNRADYGFILCYWRHYYVLPLESCGAGGVSDSSYYLLGFLDSSKWEEREKETKGFGMVS